MKETKHGAAQADEVELIIGNSNSGLVLSARYNQAPSHGKTFFK